MSSVASVASSTDSLQGVDQDNEAGAAGNSSIVVTSISVSYINNSHTLYILIECHIRMNDVVYFLCGGHDKVPLSLILTQSQEVSATAKYGNCK